VGAASCELRAKTEKDWKRLEMGREQSCSETAQLAVLISVSPPSPPPVDHQPGGALVGEPHDDDDDDVGGDGDGDHQQQ